MFSTVLDMLRPSEKLKRHEKVEFAELLKRCNLNSFDDFRTLSGPHNIAGNSFLALSDGNLKNHQRHSKTNDLNTFPHKNTSKMIPI